MELVAYKCIMCFANFLVFFINVSLAHGNRTIVNAVTFVITDFFSFDNFRFLYSRIRKYRPVFGSAGPPFT